MTTAYTIYLVEDEENLSGVLKPYMEKEGWEVTVFDNGTDALEAKEEPPICGCLILCCRGLMDTRY